MEPTTEIITSEAIETPEKTILRLQEELREKDLKIAELTELAGIDHLTELPNRRAGEERAKSLLAQASRGEITLIYARLDIDKFKDLNDTHGHAWGDFILKGLSDVLKKTKRETDMAFRGGGEEFDLILPTMPGTTIQEAGYILNRYLEAVHTLYRSKHEVGEVPEDKTPLTASFGATVIKSGESFSIKEVQEMADKALYLSKEKGRDMIHANFTYTTHLPEEEQWTYRPVPANE